MFRRHQWHKVFDHEPIANLYFAYYPTGFRHGVFRTEEEAMSWVRKQVKELVLLED